MRILQRISLAVVLVASMSASFAQATQWQLLAPGLFYTQILSPEDNTDKLHVFKIDPAKYQFGFSFAGQKRQAAYVPQLAMKANAVIAVNGGFFAPDLSPMGLRVSNQQVLTPLRKISWWGVFLIQNNHPSMVTAQQWHLTNTTTFAIQAGPRLLVNGKIPKLKPGADLRTAVGIDQDKQIILLVSDHWQLTTQALAEIMRKSTAQGGLNCVNALNLDGGSSSQLYARVNSFSANVFSLRPVVEAVVITKKS